MNLVRIGVVVALTAILGSLAILACILVPGGAAMIPVARLWSRLVLKIFRVGNRVVRDPAFDPAQPCVFVANHQSQFDIPALALSLPSDFRMVAKRELLFIPIFGWALWLGGFIFINRSDRERSIRSLDRAVRTLRKGTSVVVFAEGTRSTDGRLLPFKKGGFILAIQAGVPIVPVAIRGGHDILPKGSLSVRPGAIEVVIGAPVSTSSYALEQKDDLIAVVRERILAALGRPSVPQHAG